MRTAVITALVTSLIWAFPVLMNIRRNRIRSTNYGSEIVRANMFKLGYEEEQKYSDKIELELNEARLKAVKLQNELDRAQKELRRNKSILEDVERNRNEYREAYEKEKAQREQEESSWNEIRSGEGYEQIIEEFNN